MNYLAHLFLSRPTVGGWVGALWPDMAGRRATLPDDADVAEAAEHHRLVDRLTDVHAGHHRARQRLFADQGRFAGVVADVVADHVLSRQWPAWSDQRPFASTPATREQFIETVERGLAQGHPLMPAPMQRVVERMTAGRWLWMYADLDGLERVLWMMSQRFTQRFGRRVQLGSAVAVVERDYAGFAEDFELLMPALIQAVREAGDDPANPQPGGTL